jgi:CHASE2 domain-containing sensor protein
MKTTELTVQLPQAEVQFLEAYAQAHSLSLAELLARFARRLQPRPPHPANLKFTGAVPANVDARAEYRRHLEKKHR